MPQGIDTDSMSTSLSGYLCPNVLRHMRRPNFTSGPLSNVPLIPRTALPER